MIARNPIFSTIVAIATAAVMVSLQTGTALAQNSCKGIAKSKCENSASCSWVNSYKTKTGTMVNAYCRAKSSKGAAKTTDKSTTKAKTTSKAKSTAATDKAKKTKSDKKKSVSKKTTDAKKKSTKKVADTKKKTQKSGKTVSTSADKLDPSKSAKPKTSQK